MPDLTQPIPNDLEAHPRQTLSNAIGNQVLFLSHDGVHIYDIMRNKFISVKNKHSYDCNTNLYFVRIDTNLQSPKQETINYNQCKWFTKNSVILHELTDDTFENIVIDFDQMDVEIDCKERWQQISQSAYCIAMEETHVTVEKVPDEGTRVRYEKKESIARKLKKQSISWTVDFDDIKNETENDNRKENDSKDQNWDHDENTPKLNMSKWNIPNENGCQIKFEDGSETDLIQASFDDDFVVATKNENTQRDNLHNDTSTSNVAGDVIIVTNNEVNNHKNDTTSAREETRVEIAEEKRKQNTGSNASDDNDNTNTSTGDATILKVENTGNDATDSIIMHDNDNGANGHVIKNDNGNVYDKNSNICDTQAENDDNGNIEDNATDWDIDSCNIPFAEIDAINTLKHGDETDDDFSFGSAFAPEVSPIDGSILPASATIDISNESKEADIENKDTSTIAIDATEEKTDAEKKANKDIEEFIEESVSDNNNNNNDNTSDAITGKIKHDIKDNTDNDSFMKDKNGNDENVNNCDSQTENDDLIDKIEDDIANGLVHEDEIIELTLKSQDQQTFTIQKDIAMLSTLIKTMWSWDKSKTKIPLPNVRGSILKKVIEYMEYHNTNDPKEIEKPLKSTNMREMVSEWEANFVEVHEKILFELILAAKYMDIKPLLDLTCAKVASMTKGKTKEEIRKQFNIENDFSFDWDYIDNYNQPLETDAVHTVKHEDNKTGDEIVDMDTLIPWDPFDLKQISIDQIENIGKEEKEKENETEKVNEEENKKNEIVLIQKEANKDKKENSKKELMSMSLKDTDILQSHKVGGVCTSLLLNLPYTISFIFRNYVDVHDTVFGFQFNIELLICDKDELIAFKYDHICVGANCCKLEYVCSLKLNGVYKNHGMCFVPHMQLNGCDLIFIFGSDQMDFASSLKFIKRKHSADQSDIHLEEAKDFSNDFIQRCGVNDIIPGQSKYHSFGFLSYQNVLFLFGGIIEDGAGANIKILNNIFYCDFQEWKWKKSDIV